MSTDLDTGAPTGTPTRTSTVLAALVGLSVVALLVLQVDLVAAPVVVGSLGALALAAALWLVSQSRWQPVARVLAGALAIPVAVGPIAATLGIVLLAAGAAFPVENSAALSVLSLTVVTQVGVVWGCVLAVLGLLLGVRNVADGETIATYHALSIRTGLVPGVVAVVLVVGAFLARETARIVQVDAFVQWVFVPAPFRTHLATALGVWALAAVAVRGAIRALPVAELLADRGGGELDERGLSRLLSLLGWFAAAAGLAAVVALAVELAIAQPDLRRLLGRDLYGLVVDLSTAPGLRLLAVGAVVVSTAVVLATTGLRRTASASPRTVAERVGPFVAGVVLTVAALAAGRPVAGIVLGLVGERLPGAFDDLFFEYANALLDLFGPGTLVVTAVALLVVVTVALLSVLRVAVATGYLSDETAGYSLASAGLFVAAAFAGVFVSGAWVVFAALVGSLFVWDVGRYATTLGREVGRQAPTGDAELVHAGGTLAVGLLGVGVAYGIETLLPSGAVEASPAAVLALVGVLVGIVALAAALR